MATLPNGDLKRAERILDAADAVFGEVGFDAANVRTIAERAEVNKALVFYYYGSKEALFERVLERYYRAHQAALEGAIDPVRPVASQLHALIDAYLDFIDEHRQFPRLVQGMVASGGPQTELIRHSLEPLFVWTVRAIGELAPNAGPLAARQFFVTFSGAVINYFTYSAVLEPIWGSDPLSDEAIADRRAHLHWLVDVVVAGLVAVSDRAGDGTAT